MDSGVPVTKGDIAQLTATIQALDVRVQKTEVTLEVLTANTNRAVTTVEKQQQSIVQIIKWLKGDWDDDGEYEPGLIQQSKTLHQAIRGGIRVGIWLLGIITVALVGIFAQALAHTFHLGGVQ